MVDSKDAGGTVNSLNIIHEEHRAIGSILADALDDDTDALSELRPYGGLGISDRENVRYREVVLPPHLPETAALKGMRHPYRLWSMVDDHAKGMKDPIVAREFTMTFPNEMTLVGQLTLLRSVSGTMARTYRTPVDFTLHGPEPDEEPDDGEQREVHRLGLSKGVILLPPYELTAAGFGTGDGTEPDVSSYFKEPNAIKAFLSGLAEQAMENFDEKFMRRQAVRNFKARQLQSVTLQNRTQQKVLLQSPALDDHNDR